MAEELTYLIREAVLEDVPGIAHVHLATWRTTYAGLMPDAVIEGFTLERREAQWRQVLSPRTDSETSSGGEFIYVAVNAESGQIVGFASGGVERSKKSPEYDGEISSIYVLSESQGHQLGRKLAVKVAQRLKAQGYQGMLVWVLANNPYRKFYEALGGQFVLEQNFTLGGAELIEAAYGWPDLATFPGIGDGDVNGGA